MVVNRVKRLLSHHIFLLVHTIKNSLFFIVIYFYINWFISLGNLHFLSITILRGLGRYFMHFTCSFLFFIYHRRGSFMLSGMGCKGIVLGHRLNLSTNILLLLFVYLKLYWNLHNPRFKILSKWFIF